jgi:putative aldouronate transport system substrate-binding protein
MIREDLRQKYNLPEIDSWETLEQYIFTIPKNEPGIQGYAAAAATWELLNVYMEDRHVKLTEQPIYFAWEWREDEPGREPGPEDLEFLYTSRWYKDYAGTMKRWMEEGVWSRNVLNNTITVRDSFTQGKSATVFWNDTLYDIGTGMEANGVGKANWYDISPEFPVKRQSYSNNCWAIASISEQPERAALALDLMKTNWPLNMLLRGGIEGRHYIEKDEKTYLPGPEAVKYPMNNWTWALHHPKEPRLAWTDKTPPKRIELSENMDSRITDFNIDGFRVDAESFSTEWVVITALLEEYRPSFECGAFGEQTERKLVEFENKLKAAGLDKVISGVRSQYADFLKK